MAAGQRMSAAVSTSHMQCWRGSETPLRPTAWVELEHDPEKWIPVFRKRSCSNKKIEWDDDSKKSHRALVDWHEPFGPLRRQDFDRFEIQDRGFALSDDCRAFALLG